MPANRLLQHYVDNARKLPWRAGPGEPARDAYLVWLSEIMLQQTTVAAVTPRFERFVTRWPTVEALAAASDEDVLAEWAGLGYYARARNLLACAREVARRGGFPSTEAGLRKLPGIGDYTAAAIAAIAFGQRALVIDTNVERIIARLGGIDTQASRPRVRALLDALTPDDRAGDFAQAMMDLGATICRPRAPQCTRCPLAIDCVAAASGNPERFPAPRRKPARPLRRGIASWIQKGDCVWLVRRPPEGLLGGMAALPGSEWTQAPELPPGSIVLATVSHVFTHFRLELAIVSSNEPTADGWWQPLESIWEAGLPTLYRRAAEAVIGTRKALAA